MNGDIDGPWTSLKTKAFFKQEYKIQLDIKEAKELINEWDKSDKMFEEFFSKTESLDKNNKED